MADPNLTSNRQPMPENAVNRRVDRASNPTTARSAPHGRGRTGRSVLNGMNCTVDQTRKPVTELQPRMK